MPLSDTLGNKSPGELIKAGDWNTLVAALDGVAASVDALSTQVDARFAALEARAAALDNRVDAVEALGEPVAALLAVNRRLEFQTAKPTYAFGQLAPIEARIGSLPGAPPLDLTNAATRPWVDFFATWGELQPAPGTVVRASGGQRSLSVQVDGGGVARALLRAETSQRLPVASEKEVDATLAAQVQGRPLASWILGADTPTASEVRPAFERLSVEYQRPDALHVREFLDVRYDYRPTDFRLDPGIFEPILPQTWRDERATVIAILKPDASPETADASLGVSSLQVVFRDWTRPWFYLHFLDKTQVLPIETDFRERFGARGETTFEGTLSGFREEAAERLAGVGALGRLRAYRAMDGALDKLGAGSTASGPLREASESMRRAVLAEQGVETGRAGTLLLDALAASDALAGAKSTGAKAEVAGAVQQEVRRAREEFSLEVEEQTRNVDLRLNDFKSRVDGVSAQVSRKADVELIDRLLPR